MMENDKTRFDTFNQSIGLCLQLGEHGKALSIVRAYESEHPSDMSIRFIKHGVLIDIGFGLRDPTIVTEGIASGIELLKATLPVKLRIGVLYNLANGFSDLYKISEWGKVGSIPNSDNLQKAKELNREALRLAETNDHAQRVKTSVNLANTYDHLGRGVEAIQLYDDVIAVEPKFSMAIANRARALRYFADISGEYWATMNIEAYQAIKSVIDNPDLIEVGGYEAKLGFENELASIESLFREPELLKRPVIHPDYDDSTFSDFERFYVEYAVRERLFLNVHLHKPRSEAAIVDSILFTMVTQIRDDQRFFSLAKWINQIKEDFAIARLQLIESQFNSPDMNAISRRTIYVDSLDYSRFDLYSGKLKAAFQHGYNILDKVAGFLNHYLHLGISPSKVSFSKIWETDGHLRDDFLKTDNISLFALYDIYKDIERGYYKDLKQTRHALTHRKLVIRDLVPSDRPVEPSEEIQYKILLEQTNMLMRVLRGAIIYLINFVNEEEGKTGRGHITVPSPVFTM